MSLLPLALPVSPGKENSPHVCPPLGPIKHLLLSGQLTSASALIGCLGAPDDLFGNRRNARLGLCKARCSASSLFEPGTEQSPASKETPTLRSRFFLSPRSSSILVPPSIVSLVQSCAVSVLFSHHELPGLAEPGPRVQGPSPRGRVVMTCAAPPPTLVFRFSILTLLLAQLSRALRDQRRLFSSSRPVGMHWN